MESKSRDREMRIEMKAASKEDVLAAIGQFLESQDWGRIGFEKDGESFSILATSEVEPSASS
jgi:hypothetical protein